MQERAAAINADLFIQSSPGQGTTICVSWIAKDNHRQMPEKEETK
jgi:nitrate/nitrite-specific signal transduction histidine kinase